MKKLTLAFILFLITLSCVFSQDQITISINKNSSSELILTVQGHTTPIIIKVGDQHVTLYAEENKVNLTDMGICSCMCINELAKVTVETTESESKSTEAVEDVETASGVENSIDTQATAALIPPINPFINPNPPLSTPY